MALALSGILLSSGSLAMADPARVAALGDSLVQGYGLPQGQGFVPQMQAWLDQHGIEAELVNAGVSGDTTAGGLARVDWTLSEDPDALIVSLGGNDVLRGLDPAAARGNLDGILTAAQQRQIPVLLIGIAAPNNYGADYKTEFEAIYPDLAAKYGALLHANFLQALTEMTDQSAAAARYLQADGLHPNAEGVRLIVESIGPKVAELVEKAD